MGFKNVSLIDAHGFHAGDVIVAHGNNIIPNDFRAELLSLALHIIHEFRSHNAVGETWKILHFSGVDELPPGVSAPAMTSGLNPARPKYMAAVYPAGPDPTIITSRKSLIFPL